MQTITKDKKKDITRIQFTYLGKRQSITPCGLTYEKFHDLLSLNRNSHAICMKNYELLQTKVTFFSKLKLRNVKISYSVRKMAYGNCDLIRVLRIYLMATRKNVTLSHLYIYMHKHLCNHKE